ncbi:MAG: HalOD1 output domain-containing protein [Haloglomus sp.]
MKSVRPSRQVVETVASHEGIAPNEFSTPLYEVIDPEALDALVEGCESRGTGPLEVAFEYQEYEVRVTVSTATETTVRVTTTTPEESQHSPNHSVPATE